MIYGSVPFSGLHCPWLLLYLSICLWLFWYGTYLHVSGGLLALRPGACSASFRTPLLCFGGMVLRDDSVVVAVIPIGYTALYRIDSTIATFAE